MSNRYQKDFGALKNVNKIYHNPERRMWSGVAFFTSNRIFYKSLFIIVEYLSYYNNILDYTIRTNLINTAIRDSKLRILFKIQNRKYRIT